MIIPDYAGNTVIDTGCATFKYSIITIFKTKILRAIVSRLIIYYLYTPTAVSSHNEHLQLSSSLRYSLQSYLHCITTIKAGDWS